MRKYESLTKAEKEKLKMYWLIKGSLQLRGAMLCVPSFIGFIISVGLIATGYIPMLISGAVVSAVSLIYVFIILNQLQQDEKHIFLAFEMENSMTDIFEIKKTDILNLKKTWKKVEE